MTEADDVQRIVDEVKARNKVTPWRVAMLPFFRARQDSTLPIPHLDLLQLAVATRGGTVSGTREGLLEYLEDLEADGYVPDLGSLSKALLAFGRDGIKDLDLPEDDEEEPEPPTGGGGTEDDANPLNL
jgi:hypothetical protein